MKTLPEHSLLSHVRGQILVKGTMGEQSCTLAPLPAQKQLGETEMRHKVNVSETGTDVLLATKVLLG